MKTLVLMLVWIVPTYMALRSLALLWHAIYRPTPPVVPATGNTAPRRTWTDLAYAKLYHSLQTDSPRLTRLHIEAIVKRRMQERSAKEIRP